MNKTHRIMEKQMTDLYGVLSSFEIPVYEDEIAEDEEKKLLSDYHCFVYETGDITKNEDNRTLGQEVTIYYYSENRTDLDTRAIDFVLALSEIKTMSFRRSEKQRLQKKDTDQFVDRVILTYNRKIPVGCDL